jgi:hypothetical protein
MSPLLAFADDIDIIGRSQSAVRDSYLALEREPAKVGLKINEQKTECMIGARNDRKIRDVGQRVAIGDKHFEVVKEFVYLGSLMTLTNDVSLEIQRRIQTQIGDANGFTSDIYSEKIINWSASEKIQYGCEFRICVKILFPQHGLCLNL